MTEKIRLEDAHEATKWMEKHYLKQIKNRTGFLVLVVVVNIIISVLF